MEDEDAEGVATTLRIAAAIAAASVATVNPVGGIVLAAGGPVVDAVIDRARQRRREALEYTLHMGAGVAGFTVEELVDRLTADPGKALVLMTALEAAAQTAWRRKMRVLGRALANGVLLDDDAKVDEEQAWIRLIQGIEAPHLRILAAVDREDPEAPGHMFALTRTQLKQVSGFDSLIGGTLASLERDTLIRSTDGTGMGQHFQARWGLSVGRGSVVYIRGELTKACLQRFLDVAEG
ncbi:hypothetical protein [Cellulomonas endometrii]|uniref:hypothetical protein n=1 Tax=Cellulomonas endometrii TaxID=3036301 RepID=UPI0024AD708E|nr:hypothetical protein [Cellulomonas endometrii]